MTTLRTFLAVEIGEGARRAAAAVSERLAREVRGREVRWAKPESYHVTMRFLGDTAEDAVAPLAARVAEALAGSSPFELRLGALALFPSPRRPRVVAIGLEPEAPLAALAERLERAARAAGFAPEERSFRAHLTLGRVRDRAHPDLASAVVPAAEPFRVTEVVLWKSDLLPDGSVHTPLERIALGNPGPTETHEGAAVHGDEERPTSRAPRGARGSRKPEAQGHRARALDDREAVREGGHPHAR